MDIHNCFNCSLCKTKIKVRLRNEELIRLSRQDENLLYNILVDINKLMPELVAKIMIKNFAKKYFKKKLKTIYE